MGGVHGIKETSEAAVGALALATLMVSKFKDGVQFADFYEMWQAWQNDPVFKQKLLIAYEGYKAIPDEVAEIDLDDSFDLIVALIPAIKELIAELKSRPAED